MAGMYRVKFDKKALKDLQKLEKSGRKADMERVLRFLSEVGEHPRRGTGGIEQMRHCAVETWSRRVNQKDRFVYEIYEEEGLVIVKQALGHYADR